MDADKLELLVVALGEMAEGGTLDAMPSIDDAKSKLGDDVSAEELEAAWKAFKAGKQDEANKKGFDQANEASRKLTESLAKQQADQDKAKAKKKSDARKRMEAEQKAEAKAEAAKDKVTNHLKTNDIEIQGVVIPKNGGVAGVLKFDGEKPIHAAWIKAGVISVEYSSKK